MTKHLSILSDREQSVRLGRRHLERYKALWPESQRTEAQSFLIEQLQKQLKIMGIKEL